jgi:hypothetical protein
LALYSSTPAPWSRVICQIPARWRRDQDRKGQQGKGRDARIDREPVALSDGGSVRKVRTDRRTLTGLCWCFVKHRLGQKLAPCGRFPQLYPHSGLYGARSADWLGLRDLRNRDDQVKFLFRRSPWRGHPGPESGGCPGITAIVATALRDQLPPQLRARSQPGIFAYYDGPRPITAARARPPPIGQDGRRYLLASAAGPAQPS